MSNIYSDSCVISSHRLLHIKTQISFNSSPHTILCFPFNNYNNVKTLETFLKIYDQPNKPILSQYYEYSFKNIRNNDYQITYFRLKSDHYLAMRRQKQPVSFSTNTEV